MCACVCANNLFADCGKYLQIGKAAQTKKYLDKIAITTAAATEKKRPHKYKYE